MDKHMPHLLVMYKVCASSPRRATEEPRRAEVPLPLPSPTGLASLSRPRARGNGRRWRRCPNQDAAHKHTPSDSDCLLSSFSKKISCYFYGSSFCTLQVLGRRALTLHFVIPVFSGHSLMGVFRSHKIYKLSITYITSPVTLKH